MLSPLILLTLGATLLLLHVLLTIFRPGLRSIPGPFFAKFTNLYRVWLTQKGTYSYDLVELHRKYGPTVRIGPDTVSLTDPRVVESIYGYRTNFPKSDWVKSSQTLYKGKTVPALMTTQDKEYHVTLKKSIASAYSVTTLMGYESSVEDTVRLLLERLDELFAKTGDVCPLHKWLQWYAYDVIGAITMSKPMGLLEQGKDVDNMLHDITVEAEYRSTAAVMPIIDWICRKNPIMAYLSNPTHKIMVRARAMLQERLKLQEQTDESHRDFISRFLEAKEKRPDVLNDRNMMGFVGSNLQAGSDTTAIALRTIMYFVMKNPDILAKMRKELEGVKYPIPFQQAFSEFPYLDAVIREAIRYHPPFALQLERTVPACGLELPDGTFLREGTNVGMFGYTYHLNKDIFGEDAEKFNPERWLQKDDETAEAFKARLHLMKSSDMSFGHGQRRCVGVHVAELQMYKVVPALVGLLDIELVNPEKEWSVRQRFFALQSGMDVKVKWRKGMGLRDLDGRRDSFDLEHTAAH